MIISGFEASFLIPGASNLKEKRMVVKSVIERLKGRFNASVVESSDHDKWQKCSLGVAIAAISSSAADNLMQRIVDFLYQDDRIEIIDIIYH